MGEDFATLLCFLGQFTGGDLLGLYWSIGNSSSFDSTIQSTCTSGSLLGLLTNLLCGISTALDRLFGTGGFGLAQTHNSFEADSSFLQPDWGTLNGLDASTVDMFAVRTFWSKKLGDGTFNNFQIFTSWASYRKNYGIANNPCYMRVPATLVASLGAYSLVPRCFSNFTAEFPDGTLTASTLASFFSLSIDSLGNPQPKGLGKEQIPENW